MTSTAAPERAPRRRRTAQFASVADGSAWAGLLVAIALVSLAMALPATTGWDVHVRSFPPLHAYWNPRLGPGTAPAIVLAILASWRSVTLAASLSWRALLIAVYAAGAAWMLALATVDGEPGVGAILDTSYEYLPTARETTDFPATLREYTERIPYDAPQGNWPVHVAGHPPGALGFFVLLTRLGLGDPTAAGLVVTAIAASTAVAVLVAVRVLGAESAARRAAPFLVFGPAAIWQSVSADAIFAAIAAWGIAALAVAAVRGSLAWSLIAGALLGYCVMLSYGLPLLGVLALTVLWCARSWRPLIPAALAASGVVLAFAAYGFAWWEGLAELRGRYWDGVASRRPASYWMWGNLAALLCSAGPLAAAGVARAAAGSRVVGDAVVRRLVGAGVAMVLLADASQMSKAEVERIWLPFVPWLLIGCALLPERWRRAGLVLQLVAALAIQHLLSPDW